MAWAAPAQHQINHPSEMSNSQISPEEMDRLQEIHELINLLFAEMTNRSMQNAAMPYMTPGMMSAMQSTPYAHSLFQYGWGMSPYLRAPGY